MNRKNIIYMDYAAATPLDAKVGEAMRPFWEQLYANPSAIHTEAQVVKRAIAAAREQVAHILHGIPEEIVFTSGGTESNNLAIFGVVRDALRSGIEHPHVIVSAIEHPSVLVTAQALEQEGAQVTRVPVTDIGLVDTRRFKDALTSETVLVSIMYANNEIGTVQPIKEIASIIRHFRKQDRGHIYPLFHTDACQAAGLLDLNLAALGVDLATFSSAKMYGPKGSGILWIKKGVAIAPLLHGGAQEQARRAGTPFVPGIMGSAAALLLAEALRTKEVARLLELQHLFFTSLKEHYGDRMHINGDQVRRIPSNVNVSFPGIEGEELVLALDARGIMVSTGSACQSEKNEASHVITALDPDPLRARGSVRLSMGRSTTVEDVRAVLAALKEITSRLMK